MYFGFECFDGGGLSAAFALQLSPVSFRSIAVFWWEEADGFWPCLCYGQRLLGAGLSTIATASYSY